MLTEEARRPWVWGGAGLFLGLLIVVCDQLIPQKPAVQVSNKEKNLYVTDWTLNNKIIWPKRKILCHWLVLCWHIHMNTETLCHWRLELKEEIWLHREKHYIPDWSLTDINVWHFTAIVIWTQRATLCHWLILYLHTHLTTERNTMSLTDPLMIETSDHRNTMSLTDHWMSQTSDHKEKHYVMDWSFNDIELWSQKEPSITDSLFTDINIRPQTITLCHWLIL